MASLSLEDSILIKFLNDTQVTILKGSLTYAVCLIPASWIFPSSRLIDIVCTFQADGERVANRLNMMSWTVSPQNDMKNIEKIKLDEAQYLALHVNTLKSLEASINDKKKKYIDKVSSLMSTIESVLTHYVTQTSPEQTVLLFEFLYRHTLNLVLHGDWGKNNAAKNHMSLIFKRFETVAIKKNLPSIVNNISSLLDLLCDPWGNSTISRILQGELCPEEEVLNLIKAEMGMVLIVRLEIMAEARCDVQALRLIEVCLQCVTSPATSHYFNAYTEEIIYIRDIYLILLVRGKENAKVLNEVNKMGLVESLKVVRRCARADRTVRLRKSRIKMADVVANVALVSAMIQPVTEEQPLYDLIEEWFNLYPDTLVLFQLIRDMILTAVSSTHIYILGRLLVKKYGETEKSLCIEMLIKALTVNLNELEKYKSNCEYDKVKEAESLLANGFLQLGDYLKSDIITCRECVLTAFSLDPSEICYEKIKELAITSGKLRQVDDNCENNQSSINCEKPVTENQNPGMFLDTGQVFENDHLNQSHSQHSKLDPEPHVKSMEPTTTLSSNDGKGTQVKYEVVSSPIHISDAQKLGIPQTLYDDLSTVISSARYLLLNWNLDWAELSARCESYIASGKEVRRSTKELKYLNIDYNIFKNWPKCREFDSGIEKGFEGCIMNASGDEFDNFSDPSSSLLLRENTGTENCQISSVTIPRKVCTDVSSSATSSGSEYDPKPAKCLVRNFKRKALLSISECDSVIQGARPKEVGINGEFFRKTYKKKPKSKQLEIKSDSKELTCKKNNVFYSIKSKDSHSNDLLDLLSIEEDAQNSTPFPLLHTSPTKNEIGYPQAPRKVPRKTKHVERPGYSIVENDLSLSSTYSSHSKISDPNVLKSLRNFRTKKSVPASLNSCQPMTLMEKMKPMLSTVDLLPQIMSRCKTNKTSDNVINIDVDSDPEIINLVDDEEEDNNMNTINSSGYKSNNPSEITEFMKKKFDILTHKNGTRKSAFSIPNRIKDLNSKPHPINDLDRALGLKSLRMIRPATSPTTVHVVQLSNSVRPLVTSNNNSAPITTYIYTIPRQTAPVSHGQISNSSVATNTTVIYSTPQLTSVLPAQVSGSNIASSTSVIYSIPQQTTTASHVPHRSLLVTSGGSSKTVSSNSSVTNRVISVTGSQSVGTNMQSTSTSSTSIEGSPLRSFFTIPQRQVYSQAPGLFLSRQSTEQSSLSSSVTTASLNTRRSTPSPRDSGLSTPNTENSSLIRVERIALLSHTDTNQAVPNLSPIKSTVSTRPQVNSLNRQLYARSGNVSRATAAASTQSQSVVSLNRQATAISTRSMPVTAHIQRVGFPPESSTTQNSSGVQKYLFKEGVLVPGAKKHINEREVETPSVSALSNTEQGTQRKTTQTDKSKRSHHGASLPKFQQAFGRTMYQSTSTATSPSNEASQLNFPHQVQSTNNVTDSTTSTSTCAVLSKAVQTTSKDSETSNKKITHSCISNDNSSNSKISLTGNASTSTNQTIQTSHIETSSITLAKSKSASDRSVPISQNPVKYLCKVPVSIQGKSVAFLKTTQSTEKLPQTQGKLETESRTVIHSNVSALLAAALQSQPHLRQPTSSVTSSFHTVKTSSESEKKKADLVQSTTKNTHSKSYRKSSVGNQHVSRYTKPLLQVSGPERSQLTVATTSVVTIPIRTVLATGQQTNTSSRLDRVEVCSETLGSPSTSDDPSSNSLHQQLQEFESVFNKVKKTSQMKERTNSTTVNQSQSSLSQQIRLTHPSSSDSVEFTSTGSDQAVLFQSTSSNTVHDLQGEQVGLTFISQPTTSGTNTIIAGSSQKITASTPVVVVQSCSKPVASPALSVTSQSSSSPAPPSTPGSSSGKITPASIVKSNKSSKTKTASKAATPIPTPTTTTTTTTTLKVSTLPKPQQKPQEDEQTTQRIYAILDKYAEQLRNSPELKNKPAPRRRSNPPTNPSHSSKRKKSSHSKSKVPSQQASCSSSGMEMSPSSEDLRTMGSEDSSNGVSQLSQTLNSPQSRQDGPSTPTGGDVSSETSESLDSRDTRTQSRVVLTETCTGQSRTVIVQDSKQSQVLNMDTTKLLTSKSVVVGSQIVPQLVLPNVAGVPKMLFPVPPDGRPLVVSKGPKMYKVHQFSMPKGSAPLIGPGAVVLRQMCSTPSVKQVKLPSGLSPHNIGGVMPPGTQTFTLTHDPNFESGESININIDNTVLLDSATSQPISFLHRSIPTSSYQSRDSLSSAASSTTATSVIASPQKTSVVFSSSEPILNYLKQEPVTMSVCSSLNVIPLSSSQDVKSVIKSEKSTSMGPINLEDEIDFSVTNRSSEVPTLIVSHARKDDKRWKTTESAKLQTLDTIKKEEKCEDLSSFQTVKTMTAHRSSSTSGLLPQQDRIDFKKNQIKVELTEECQVKEEIKTEPGLCDEESVSSDSAGSGRVKTRRGEKTHSMPETSQDTGSPWPYNVTKIECIVKSESPSTSVKQSETDNQPLSLSQPQVAGNYKKKVNNVENTIYQMAFKRSERSRLSSKDHDRNLTALERDLRLQKSLSEECEDLGVDEPSTSDLFPEAELLLDPDHSSRDSQLDLSSEILSQALNSSSSCDSRAMSPMFPFGRRPLIYRSSKSQSTSNRSSRFLSSFNPSFQFVEESTSATLSCTRDDSPDNQVVSNRLRGNKFGSNSDSSSPCLTKSFAKGNLSPVTNLQEKALTRDRNKSSSSGASTPINGSELRISPRNDELPNSFIAEGSQCVKKSNNDNCKDTEVDTTTTDSDSNIDSLNTSSCQENITGTRGTFVPIPNPAVNAPFTYSSSRNNPKSSSKRSQVKQEVWKNIIKGSHAKEEVESDMSEPDPVKVSDKRSTSTEEDLPSEGEIRAKNGLVSGSDETQSSTERNVRSTKKSRKRTGSVVKCSSAKSKVSRRSEPLCVAEHSPEPSISICKNAASHHDMSSRRSSLRGHIKKNCPCCNGSQEKNKSPAKSPPKTEKLVCASSPSSSSVVSGTSKKKAKSSHITKKR